MKKELTLLQACMAAVAFYDKEYFNHYSDDLACCTSELMFHRDEENWQENPITWDPAAWHDWLSVAGKMLRSDTISKDTKISILEGYRIMQAFVYDYANRLNSADMKKLAVALDLNDEVLPTTNRWKDWLLCVDTVLTDSLEPQGGLLGFGSLISQQQSLDIMQQFLKDYCIKANNIQDMAWFEHVQHLDLGKNRMDAVLNDWLTSYHGFVEDSSNQLDIRVFQAFNVMRIFVDKQQKNMHSQDLGILLKTLQVDRDQRPREYSIEYNWMHAAYAVVFK